MVKQILYNHFNGVYGGGEAMEEMMLEGDPIRILPHEVVEAVQRLSVHKAPSVRRRFPAPLQEVHHHWRSQ
eukprot:4863982-Heterocapsa_arctica.AAC.1